MHDCIEHTWGWLVRHPLHPWRSQLDAVWATDTARTPTLNG